MRIPMDELEKSLVVARLEVDSTSECHPDRAISLSNLAHQLDLKYMRTKAMGDLDKAIGIAREAVDMTSEGHPDHAKYMIQLGILLGERNDETTAMDELEEAIGLFRRGLKATPENHPNLADRLLKLETALWHKYLTTNATADFNEANQVHRQAIDAMSDSHPMWKTHLDDLANQLGMIEGMVDRDEAIRMTQEALAAAREDDPDRTLCFHLQNLGDQLRSRYVERNVVADLDEAIRLHQEVLKITPSYHPTRACRLRNLALDYSYRHSNTNTIAHLEIAIRLYQDALGLTPGSHPARAGRLTDLAMAYISRHQRTMSTVDFEEAARFYREALGIMPLNDPRRNSCLRNLGCLYEGRYNATQNALNTADLDKAMELYQQAVDQKLVQRQERSINLRYLAMGYRTRHLSRRKPRVDRDAGDTTDIDMAIKFSEEALGITPPDNPRWIYRLQDLGYSHKLRFETTNETADFLRATKLYQSLLDATPSDHGTRALWLQDVATLYATTSRDDAKAIQLLLEAINHSTSLIKQRLQACGHLLGVCVRAKAWKQAYQGACMTVHLLQSLTPRFLQTSDKQFALSNAQLTGLACNAAAAVLRAGTGPLETLQVLERGRGVLSASLEEVRTDILSLGETDPDLARRFIRIRDELELYFPHKDEFLDERVQRRDKAAKEFDDLIVDIRKRPNFENFLLPPSEEEIYAAARYGPIVVINVSPWGCDALLVGRNQVQALSLRNLSTRTIQEKEKEKVGNAGSPEVLEWLWDAVAGPILDALGFTEPPSDDNWPHVWWIPTGPLTKFPIHAAGRHGKGSQAVLDRVMSSYSSSIRAIIHGRRRSVIPSASSHALLVAMKHTPGHARLAFAPKEVAVLRDLCRSMALDPIEPAEQHKKCLLTHLRDCKIFHFAGHGYTDNNDPSKSSLCLTDGRNNPLTVADLLDMNLRERSPFLAYLSACGTGQNKDMALYDESIHLISACQLAGFRHVIGTLWEVNDQVCVDMARITYEGMRDGDMSDESVSRGLHNASRELRDRWLEQQDKAGHGNGRERKRVLRGSKWEKKVVGLGSTWARKPVDYGSKWVRKASVGTRWVRKASRERSWVTQTGVLSTRGQMGVRCPRFAKPKSGRLPRDVALCEDDEHDEAPPHWVPYVHFGV